ncbi:MAG: DUF3298 domain-containing protein [Ruminococcaceae bacterium]|nr:DUF3298 domain-containing protein [Oscillospiraceae bacterium]
MKKARKEPELTVELKRQEWEMALEGECVLHCVLTWPELTGTWKGIGAINRYYIHAAEIWRRRWERELFCMACLDLADRRAQGRPFRVWKAELETQITLQENGLLSLWQEGRECRGYDQTQILRRGDTWSLSDGAPRTLASFFVKERHWKKRLIQQVEKQMGERLNSGESLLDEDCVKRLKREFDRENFYLTADGIQLFFPLYALAPGAEGIPVFAIG